jgi:hypothetical protein
MKFDKFLSQLSETVEIQDLAFDIRHEYKDKDQITKAELKKGIEIYSSRKKLTAQEMKDLIANLEYRELKVV